MCQGQPTASVSCGSEESEEHPKEIEIRVIYWLTTQLPFYKETVHYDVLQYPSTAITTATRTVSNNATALDMLSYTSLIPSAQAAPSGPYIISEVGAVYGTIEEIGTATITYPTPYALIVNRVHVHQMGMCEDGTEFSTSAWFNQPAPIPLPTTLAYQNMSAEVNLTIPDFNDAFHSLHPRLSYCSFSSFSGQPLPKIVVDTASARATSASTVTTTGKAMVQSAAAAAATTTTAGDARLSSAAAEIASLASYIACGLGGSCGSAAAARSTSVAGGATDSHGNTYFFAPAAAASTAPTVATLGRGDVPLYTADNGAVVVPVWRTLSAGAAAATVGDAVMSHATWREIIVMK
ncbi:Cytochrome p450 [Neofusicoccum parvum]|nr:Cytochrome p450 [Neofusicoccum parvum]